MILNLLHSLLLSLLRLPQVWGEDADQWRPERFLEGSETAQGGEKPSVGVIGNV